MFIYYYAIIMQIFDGKMVKLIILGRIFPKFLKILYKEHKLKF